MVLLHGSFSRQATRWLGDSGDAVAVGHSEPGHRIQDRAGNLSLCDLCLHGSAAHAAAELVLESRHRGLD
jgi:hypothetical protein